MLYKLLLVTSTINLRDRLLITLKKIPRNRVNTYPTIGSFEGIDGKLCTSDKDKPNALNEFFSRIFTTKDSNTVPAFM